MIRAEIHDDEFSTTAKFDATDWFVHASDDMIVSLANINWRGGMEADAVAEFFEGRGVGSPDSIDDVFSACNALDTGFEVSVEPEDAKRWLQANRPALYEELFSQES